MFEGFNENDIVGFKISDFMKMAKEIESNHNELIDQNEKLRDTILQNERKILAYKVTIEMMREILKKSEKINVELPDKGDTDIKDENSTDNVDNSSN